MTASYYTRGNLVLIGEDGLGRYADTGELAADIERPCLLCHKMPTPEGYDACLGHIPGAISACCGHGVEYGYIVMKGYQPSDSNTLKLTIEFERGSDTFWLNLKANILITTGWLLGYREAD